MLSNGRFSIKSSNFFSKVFTPVRNCNASRESDLGVVIPKRIERGPTDILKALASTVKVDPTAFPYKYPDDPFFYTFSNHDKRNYALSLESGRKSAKWIVENNPGFFKHQLSDPLIEAFLQKVVYDENSEVTPELLDSIIEKRKVSDAITVYHLLQEKGIVLSNDLKQKLLELVCFYNENEKPNTEELEFKWFGNEGEALEINTWKEKGLAENLFESMEPNCPLATSAIIQGMIKYNNVNKALEIYKKAKENNVKFPIGVYNALLTQASNTNADIPDGLTFIKDILKQISLEGIKPNVGTLNTILKSVVALKEPKKGNFVEKLMAEFNYLGVEPSLGTYYYIFRLVPQVHQKSQTSTSLYSQYLRIIQSKKFDVMHPSDFLFFPHTMKLIFGTLDAELPHRLNAILFQNDNLKFLNNANNENMYFREYFNFLFRKEPLEIAMEKYREFVPRFYTPEVNIYLTILKAISTNRNFKYLIDVWKDLKANRMSRFVKILSVVLPMAKFVNDEAVLKVIHEAAMTAVKYLEDNGMEQFPDIIPSVLIAFLRTGDGEKAVELFNGARDKNIQLPIDEETLKEVMQYALAVKNVGVIQDCLHIAESEIYPEIIKLGEAALPLLSDSDRTWIAYLLEKFNVKSDSSKKEPNNTE